ncbi:MAG TPA: hypothetical protein PK095_06130 [Myxococcota bacterium]|nr:hypothetical protein [Myxococcota bacterium]
MKPEDKELTNHILATGRTHRLSTRWKVTCIVLGILCTAIVFLLPFGVLLFIIAGKARVVTADEGVVIKWIGTRLVRWGDFAGFTQMPFRIHGGVPGLDLVGAMAVGAAKGAASAMVSGPINYVLKSGKRGGIAAHWMVDGVGLVETMEAKTGLPIAQRR